MIPLTASVCQARNRHTVTWQKAMANAIRKPEELLSFVGLTADQIPGGLHDCEEFPLRVPRGYAARIETGNPRDPLLLQVLSQRLESSTQQGFLVDPVGDKPSTVLPGLLQKYHGRVLLLTTGVCPVHCRYCFRRHYPYSENQPDYQHWSDALDYIARDNSIKEVILSGGDPLSLSTRRLRVLTQRLAEIPHIDRLRIHTRMPVVLPERINQGFLDWLGNLPWKTVIVIHCNHAQELDNEVNGALANLGATGATLLNQSVLLKGVNDTASALVNLSEALFSAGVLPYYLHMLDRVIGAVHFEVDDQKALTLMEEVRSQLPGFLVPRLVREVAGLTHKIPVQETTG